MYAYAAAIFTSAFLVFQIQPIIARFILPWFGGTPAVWAVCMLFFQVGLLLGYTYAHLLARYLSIKRQASVHLLLLLVSFIQLPIVLAQIDVLALETPLLDILWLLTVTLGMPFALLSASAPLMQHWFAQAYPEKRTFRLYALSNVGSLLALLSYPLVVEATLRLSQQTSLWSNIYLAYFVLVIWAVAPILRSAPTAESSLPTAKGAKAAASSEPPSWPRKLLWVGLSALGSIVVVAFTNQITQDVTVAPLFWVLPLSLYLISFIICFDRDTWYRRSLWYPFMAMGVALMVYVLRQDYADESLPLLFELSAYCIALFGLCMVSHGELVRARPDTQYLTLFYLLVALGGALGGVFVNFVAPLIFNGYWEVHLVIVAVGLVACLALFLDRQSLRPAARYAFSATALLALALIGEQLLQHKVDQGVQSLHTVRNFYGVVHVYEDKVGTRDHYRAMYHGRIRHGEQYPNSVRRLIPTSYYGKQSGIGYAIAHHPSRIAQQPLSVATIGLGVGTIAAYGEPYDRFSFYEINPDVELLAQQYFSYLAESKATINTFIGDGRVSLAKQLQNEGSQQFDILALDAFSGDAIPKHLLTREAFALYWQHLKADGVLAMHITNRHVDLTDVVRQLAERSGKDAYWITDVGGNLTDPNDWILVTNNQEVVAAITRLDVISTWPNLPKPIVWTDDFSNLLEVIKW